MGRAQTIVLDKGYSLAANPPGLVGDILTIRPHYHRKGRPAAVRRRGQHMGEQRLAGNLMQHLGHR